MNPNSRSLRDRGSLSRGKLIAANCGGCWSQTKNRRRNSAPRRGREDSNPRLLVLETSSLPRFSALESEASLLWDTLRDNGPTPASGHTVSLSVTLRAASAAGRPRRVRRIWPPCRRRLRSWIRVPASTPGSRQALGESARSADETRGTSKTAGGLEPRLPDPEGSSSDLGRCRGVTTKTGGLR
jgi:hypothetical protein